MLRDAYPNRPRWQWWAALPLLFLAWHGFGAWRAGWRGLRTAARFGPQLNLPRSRVWRDLPVLAFWFGANSVGYFQYRLYERPRREWADFIFPQEHDVWHGLANASRGTPGRAALADKAGFAEALAARSLATVPTLRRVPRGATLPEAELFAGRSLFLKPNSANAMRGCLELRHDPTSGSYRLLGLDLAGRPCEHGERPAIVACLAELCSREAYLLQPLLTNHPDLRALLPVPRLITLRVITARVAADATLLYTVLEVPEHDEGTWQFANVNVVTGAIEPSQNPWAKLAKQPGLLGSALGACVPEWPRCRELVLAAHRLTPDVPMVGWDLAITPDGPLIIEGNPGWNVLPPQAVSGVPLLRRLAEVKTPGPAAP
ncbi:MAG: hypothetical protein RL514_4461 [Verrucomicrobiota bacterium]|jgi:hypothetical protein